MFLPRSLSSRLSLLALTALAACATPVKQVPPTPPPAVVPTVMPTPPRYSAPDMVPPDKDDAGKFITPNRDSQGDQALWHVRMGLNVAALGCPETNGRLRQKGSGGVAKKSLHMEGRAIDVRLPGVPLAELRDAALSLQAGGVGFYPREQFVHIDTGRVRRWGG